jgi:hypothetical protein
MLLVDDCGLTSENPQIQHPLVFKQLGGGRLVDAVAVAG